MTSRSQHLTIDEAVGEFHAVVREELADAPSLTTTAPGTPEEAEAGRSRFAEYMLGLACPDPAACADQRCRRNALCRHLAHVRTQQQNGVSRHPRRTPGAEAARYAIWVYMSSGR